MRRVTKVIRIPPLGTMTVFCATYLVDVEIFWIACENTVLLELFVERFQQWI